MDSLQDLDQARDKAVKAQLMLSEERVVFHKWPGEVKLSLGIIITYIFGNNLVDVDKSPPNYPQNHIGFLTWMGIIMVNHQQ